MTNYKRNIQSFIRRESAKMHRTLLDLSVREGAKELEKFNHRLDKQYSKACFIDDLEEREQIFDQLSALKKDFLAAMENGNKFYLLKLEHQSGMDAGTRKRLNRALTQQGLSAV